MIRVRAPSRLHFGLLNCGGEADARRFGGAGLMIGAPGLSLTARPAARWSAEGPLVERVLAYARRFAATLPSDSLSPHHLHIEHAPPEHVGLGVGTQLGLSMARALACAAGLALDAVELARRVGRGERSGLGVHGFERGGFLVDGGKRAADGVAPLVARLPFPDDWRVVLILPPLGTAARHGVEERRAFEQLNQQGVDAARTDRMCRLVLLGMLPALAERDLEAFGEALFEYNARAGEMFAPFQGGTYADERVRELVAYLRGQGVRAVGQSSWGPAVFAVMADAGRAAELASQIRARFGAEVLVTPASNDGAAVTG